LAPGEAAIARKPRGGLSVRRSKTAICTARDEHIRIKIVDRSGETCRHCLAGHAAPVAARPRHHVILRIVAVPCWAALALWYRHRTRFAAVVAEQVMLDLIAARIAAVPGREIRYYRPVRRFPGAADDRTRAELALPSVDDRVVDPARLAQPFVA